ncbi:uncharacterized protein SAPINGB_P003495 [Magnusiomyces paraingens]|uniref:Trimethylguanosine synthase n=1 Tax=Magnusiomyces paraingens TaxID=2606893 RepID=A0A5E8BPM5_9ASCO|nr:uncharacterized protein SAPINGB_P003495 [Saprochaete ingens]VVT53283.1 unnamed protein product [Saprochaete ingens]
MAKRKRKQNNKSDPWVPPKETASEYSAGNRGKRARAASNISSSTDLQSTSSSQHPPEDLPPDLRRFWYSRYRLFSQFDEGIELSPEMWYSVTPEAIARVISDQIKQRYPRAHAVFDAFGGAAGNTIQFARDFTKVLYLDVNGNNVAMARHNYGVYWPRERQKVVAGVSIESESKEEKGEEEDEIKKARREALNREEYIKNEHTEFYQGDFFTFQYPPAETVITDNRFTRNDVIFLSPPWGGTSYSKSNVWDLASCQPYSIQKVVRRAREAFSDNIVLYLPRNSNLDEIINDKDLFPDLPSGEVDDSDEEKDKDCKSVEDSEAPLRPRVPALYLNDNGRCRALLLFLGPGLEPLRHDFYKP